MLKFLLILLLFIYLSFRIGGYLLRLLLGGNNPDQQRREYKKTRPRDGNVDVDYMPKKGKKGYDGGDYVDYEEVDYR